METFFNGFSLDIAVTAPAGFPDHPHRGLFDFSHLPRPVIFPRKFSFPDDKWDNSDRSIFR